MTTVMMMMITMMMMMMMMMTMMMMTMMMMTMTMMMIDDDYDKLRNSKHSYCIGNDMLGKIMTSLSLNKIKVPLVEEQQHYK